MTALHFSLLVYKTIIYLSEHDDRNPPLTNSIAELNDTPKTLHSVILNLRLALSLLPTRNKYRLGITKCHSPKLRQSKQPQHWAWSPCHGHTLLSSTKSPQSKSLVPIRHCFGLGCASLQAAFPIACTLCVPCSACSYFKPHNGLFFPHFASVCFLLPSAL